MDKHIDLPEVRDGLAVGAAGLGMLATVWRFLTGGRGTPRSVDSTRNAESVDRLQRIEEKIDRTQESIDGQFGQLRRELENHREEDNRRFTKVFDSMERLHNNGRNHW